MTSAVTLQSRISFHSMSFALDPLFRKINEFIASLFSRSEEEIFHYSTFFRFQSRRKKGERETNEKEQFFRLKASRPINYAQQNYFEMDSF